MDFNQLFYHHQVALIGARNGASVEGRRLAGERAEFYAAWIGRLRAVLGHPQAAWSTASLN